jgi:hypothetical protein
MLRPKLRTVEKYQPPFPLNKFPSDFALELGKEIVYLLATRKTSRSEGADWEEIFARVIGGRWKPSNNGMDDVLLEQTAWSVKSVKHKNPALAQHVRIISGRNSPTYSYNEENFSKMPPDEIGKMVLAIWNERVAAIRAKYQHLRTVVFIKAEDLLELAVFEHDTVMFMESDFEWSWNENNNLIGKSRKSGANCFTWQPHGSQFTINTDVPKNRLAIRIKQPPLLIRDNVLTTMNFDPSWIEIIK